MSNEAEELEEFMEIADTAFASTQPTARNHGGYPDDDDEYKVMAGELCQYAINGEGYTPTTRTVDVLPPALYDIEFPNQVPTFVPQNLVTDNLLRLPDSKSDEVIGEIERFWTLKATFKKFGYTHKRGFLLWGPPGSGKTSTISVVIQQMVKSKGIVLLVNKDPGMIAKMLGNLRKVEPDRRLVVVLEDIDTIIANYGETQTLSLLDGEASIDNVIYLATTNYPEKLDGRIINRPSRFDRVVKIGMPNEAARRVYIESRNLELSEADLKKWVDQTEHFSIAHIKELVIGVCCFGNDFDKDVLRIKSMAKMPKSDSERSTSGFGRSE